MRCGFAQQHRGTAGANIGARFSGREVMGRRAKNGVVIGL